MERILYDKNWLKPAVPARDPPSPPTPYVRQPGDPEGAGDLSRCQHTNDDGTLCCFDYGHSVMEGGKATVEKVILHNRVCHWKPAMQSNQAENQEANSVRVQCRWWRCREHESDNEARLVGEGHAAGPCFEFYKDESGNYRWRDMYLRYDGMRKHTITRHLKRNGKSAGKPDQAASPSASGRAAGAKANDGRT
ncbi:hypothetical protein BD626DRAFT_519524 [Schizophyllum amplum]|uniref:Uncharacterized protein n=1 Tax=Schizophyllum amplum TaxID=97359 RepID=A0A550BV72_9AGAR|nr:hypothetical protein BD626DRAFT_519524 [Auriculariopsis ampla]